MLKKLTIIFVAVLGIYLSCKIYAIDIIGVRQLAAINFVADISEDIYKFHNYNHKFPTSYYISNDKIYKYHINNYSYKAIDDDFKLIVKINNFITKDGVIVSNKDGVFVMYDNNTLNKIRQGIQKK